MKTWIFPNNLNFYDIEEDFKNIGKVNWGQNRKVEPGDIVYIYRSTPSHKILWKCKVGRVNYYQRKNDEYTCSVTWTQKYCHGPFFEMIPLIAFEPMEKLSFQNLKKNGLKSRLMGPQTISAELVEYLKSVEKELGSSHLYDEYASTLSIDELRKQVKAAPQVITPQRQFQRNVYVSRYAKIRANGVCQLCGKAAPFIDRTGEPYLESHHVVWLANDGPDVIENVVALCPNCHKKMHILALSSDVQKLSAAAKKGI